MKRLSQLKVFVCQYLPLSGDCWKHCHRGLPCGWIQNLRTLHCWSLTSRNAFLGDPRGWRRLKALYGWFFCLLWKDVQLHLSRSSGSLPWKMTPLPLFLLCVVFFFFLLLAFFSTSLWCNFNSLLSSVCSSSTSSGMYQLADCVYCAYFMKETKA